LNLRLAEEIRARKTIETTVPRSSEGGWHSASDLFRREEPAHRHLAGSLLGILRAATEAVAPSVDWERMALHVDGWVNLIGKGDFHAPHDHPHALLSGVYYIEAGDAEADGGEIEFLSERGGYPQRSVVPIPMTWNYYRMPPRAGTALVFPGHLKHWVRPYRGRQERISAAFNATLHSRDEK
jgi:uncharacterized protein (TIGR02466 family)